MSQQFKMSKLNVRIAGVCASEAICTRRDTNDVQRVTQWGQGCDPLQGGQLVGLGKLWKTTLWTIEVILRNKTEYYYQEDSIIFIIFRYIHETLSISVFVISYFVHSQTGTGLE